MSDNEPLEFVFTYGSLMKGGHASSFLMLCDCLGEGVTEETYRMADFEAFPAIDPWDEDGRSGHVLGEVYAVDGKVLASLDNYESVPFLYDRKLRKVYLKDGNYVLAWVYEGRDVVHGFRKENEVKPNVNGVLKWRK